MAHLALYRALRPQTFAQVVAQKHVVYPLQQAVINQEPAHAYLFCGTRGTGKTSIAKIFAKAINCLNPQNGNPCGQCEICKLLENNATLDVSEIDAASNNSVENIRHIVEEINYVPTNCKYKVYIIDEAHMLSDSAFNALLKTLEEPPSHAIFILATTEPNRIRSTILSRCQRYDFRLIPTAEMHAYLTEVAKQQQIDISEEAITTITRLAQGAMRDALSLLEQVGVGIQGHIDSEAVLSLIGSAKDHKLQQLTSALLNNDIQQLLTCTDELIMSGIDIHRLVLDFAGYLRNILVAKVSDGAYDLLNLPASTINELKEISQHIPTNTLIRLITSLHNLNNDLRFVGDTRTALEIGLISMLNQTNNKNSTNHQQIAPSKAVSNSNNSTKIPKITEAKADSHEIPKVTEAKTPSTKTPKITETKADSHEIPEVTEAKTASTKTVNPNELITSKAKPVPNNITENSTKNSTNCNVISNTNLSSEELQQLVKEKITDRFSLICLNNASFKFQDNKWQIIYDDAINANHAYSDIIRKRSALLEQLRTIFAQATGLDGHIEVLLVKSTPEENKPTKPEWVSKIQQVRDEGFDFPLNIIDQK